MLVEMSVEEREGKDKLEVLAYVRLWMPRIGRLKVRASLFRLLFNQCSLVEVKVSERRVQPGTKLGSSPDGYAV